MPTFTERLFWGQGDASDLRVFDTDIGRLGGLICGRAPDDPGTGGDDRARRGNPCGGVSRSVCAAYRTAIGGMGRRASGVLGSRLGAGPRAGGRRVSCWSACGQITEADIPDDFCPQGPHEHRLRQRRIKRHRAARGAVGWVRSKVRPSVRAELQAWMIKAWKAIIDTNGHYARARSRRAEA